MQIRAIAAAAPGAACAVSPTRPTGGPGAIRRARRNNGAMQLSERAAFAMRALIELAAAGRTLIPAGQLADEQAIPGKALEAVMTNLRRAGLVQSLRGPNGGFSLARPAAEISLAEVVGVLSRF